MTKIHIIFAVAASLSISLPVYSQSSAHNQGKDFAKEMLDSKAPKPSKEQAKEFPYYTDKPSGKSSFGAGNLFDVGVKRITSCKTAEKQGDRMQDQECDAVNFLAKNPENRVKFQIPPNDPIFPVFRENADRAPSDGAQMGACKEITTEEPSKYSTQTCEDYLEPNQPICPIGDVINVADKQKYECSATVNPRQNVSCERLLTYSCTDYIDGCDAGGIIPGTWAGDMRTTFTPMDNGDYLLQFGTVGNNYWGGRNRIYDRTLVFEIDKKDKISKFELYDVHFDDWLYVSVNGVRVYNGSKGGDRLEVVTLTETDPDTGALYTYQMVQYCATCYANGEQSSSFKRRPRIDIRPHLKEGKNEIFTRTVVSGGGEATLFIHTRQFCEPICTPVWVSNCGTLEERSK